MMRDCDDLFTALGRSQFRRRFRLGPSEQAYLTEKGIETVRGHALNLITQRLASAQPFNDGKQTPMKGHPVFIAQHATATCCRKCLARWHGIARGRALTEDEIAYIVGVIGAWLDEQIIMRRNAHTEGMGERRRQGILFDA